MATDGQRNSKSLSSLMGQGSKKWEFKTIKRPKMRETKILERRETWENKPDSPSHFSS